ncbi:MAG TPA: hypothetical protein VFU77_06495 [Steroidobacteraceae bacterium]|nr:hypothetical protein [Steroidobacteraceae bacterium]
MQEKEDTTPFPREPWQRLLEDDEPGGPPKTTDARIRKTARRDLAPRGRRWWLPASLAASFVLAVFVVQSQFGSLRVPVTAESDHGAGGAIEARVIDREETDVARPDGQSPSAASKRAPGKQDEAETDAYGYQDSELAADSAGTGPMVGGPERELKAASEAPSDAAIPEDRAATPEAGFVAPPAAPATNDARAERPATLSQDEPAARPVEARREAAPRFATPEAWYAEVEKLRAQGRLEEAERELARLNEAYPGWLERYLEKRDPR